MEKEIIIGIVGLIGVYVAYKLFFTATAKAPQKAQPQQTDPYHDILSKEEYKVKGQWEK